MTLRQVGSALSPSPTDRMLCVCQAQRKRSTQDLPFLHFGGVGGGGEASVGKGRAPESGHPEDPVFG